MRFDMGMERLERDECLRLLGTRSLGRVAVTSGALPMIFPVNYALDPARDSVVLRTCVGSNLDQAVHDAVLAFEVDLVDECDHTGWSILVRGRASEIVDRQERRRAMMLPLPCWGGQDDASTRFIRIPLKHLTGRRIGQGGRLAGSAA